jgi:hypothetical protein
MEKIEYGDVNKFLVSTGTVLIGLSFAVPYFYLKDDFGLLIENDKLKTLSVPIQLLICQKQEFVIVIQKFIPWTFGVLFLSGAGLVFWGLKRWFRRQAIIDRMDAIGLLKSEREWEQLTEPEKEEKAKNEIEANEIAQYIESKKTTEPPPAEVTYYLNVERKAVERFKRYQTDNFEILDNVRLTDRYEVDILLKAKSNTFADRIVEIKYARTSLPFEMVRTAIIKLDKYVEFYTRTYNRNVVPVLLVVFSGDTNLTVEKIRDLRQKAGSEASAYSTLQRININFIHENDLDTFDVKSILRR